MKPKVLFLTVAAGLAFLFCFYWFPGDGPRAQSRHPIPEKNLDWDALIRKRRQEAQKWAVYQKKLESELNRLEKREKIKKIKASDKAKAWSKFLDTFREDNPYSPVDEVIRKKAESRVNYWQGNKTALAVSSGKPFTNSIGMTFVKIPAGAFLMGSPPEELGQSGYEYPQHQVTISRPFYLQTTEVTQEQWKKIMGGNPSEFSGCDRCPVENISWDDAQEFIRRLNILDNTNKYRLPSEAEWEYACRAGSKTAFANGAITDTECEDSKLKEMAWFCDSTPHTAAQKKPNAWGLYDMHGNVWEWCQNWYYDYPNHPQQDPQGPMNGRLKIYRGGSYYDAAWSCRSAQRYWESPETAGYTVGFRVARSL